MQGHSADRKKLASDKEMSVARIYARSLVQLADEVGKADEVLRELHSIAEMVENDPARGAFLADPTINAVHREEVLEKTLRGRWSDLVVNSLLVMTQKGRVTFVSHLAEAYRLVLEELRGVIDVEVTTAVALTEAQMRTILDWAAAFTSKKPELIAKVKPEILGGLIVQIGDDKFDRSVIRALNQVRERLMNRASYEIQGGRVSLEAVNV